MTDSAMESTQQRIETEVKKTKVKCVWRGGATTEKGKKMM